MSNHLFNHRIRPNSSPILPSILEFVAFLTIPHTFYSNRYLDGCCPSMFDRPCYMAPICNDIDNMFGRLARLLYKAPAEKPCGDHFYNAPGSHCVRGFGSYIRICP